MTTHPRLLALALLAAATLTGCGVEDPYAGKDPAGPLAGPPAAAEPATDEKPQADTVTGATTALPAEVDRRDPRVKVAVDFGVTQATWSPDTWVRQTKRLRALSTGLARDEIDHVAADVSLEDQAAALKASQSTSRATFLAADIAEGRSSAAKATVVVVLRVQAGGEGRRETGIDYTVNEAQVTRTPKGWRVARYVTKP